MIVRAIDSNNDWTRGKGKSDYKRDKKAVMQLIQTRLQSFLADCFFAESEGLDWWNLLGGKNKQNLTLAIQTCILNTEGVNGLAETSVEVNSARKITLKYTANTVYGTVSTENTFEVASA